jgi:hypothetical protein
LLIESGKIDTYIKTADEEVASFMGVVYSPKRKVPIYKTKGTQNFQIRKQRPSNEIAVFLTFEHHSNDVLADPFKNAHRAFKVLSLLLGLLHNDRASEENLLRPQAPLS